MELNYSIDEADNLLFQRDYLVNGRSKVMAKRIRNFSLLVYCIIVIVNLIVAAVIREQKIFLIVAIIIAIELIFWTILLLTKKVGQVVWFLGKRKIKKTVHEYYAEKSLVGNGEPVKMILSETEVQVINNQVETRIAWGVVPQIVFLDDVICIYTSEMTAQLIAVKHFSTETFTELDKYLHDIAEKFGIKLIKNSK
ncbi:hypothetical protein [Culicoidibacter larvae]|uniref:YcxB family protein n=1 Tax=Culicoidibacter larvae TaxID=2579976 RepID=A0A5R8QGT4_9FIRM|nr:hypothetical protein [Culicoidibacter larvae]TLG77249.1 hypothetical protein FEZ08_01135 [Culicoidibacter larvae]